MMFKGRHFDRSVILLCVRWYLAYSLSLRDLEEMMAERGISVDHTTIHRWTIHYALLLLEQFNRRKRPVTSRWHVDKTYIKVRGQWYYLYRAIPRINMQTSLPRLRRLSGRVGTKAPRERSSALGTKS
jgi:transposase-like protein